MAPVGAFRDEGRATLFHVVEYLPTVTEGTFGVYAHRRDIDDIKRLSLEKIHEYARAHSGHRFETLVKEGKPAAAILDTAAALGVDLIVIGTHGRSRLDHLLIGSVTERVLRKATCSVLAVRP